MSTLLRIGIHGAAGRMGQAVLRAGAQPADIEIIAALVRSMPADDGPDLAGSRLFSTALPDEAQLDVLIDFSTATAFDSALAIALEHNCAFVSGTTGLSARQQESLTAAAGQIPVLWAANFSLGIAVLRRVVAQAARALPEWDCEILEAHHRFKRDAPSGTALVLGQDVAAARRVDMRHAQPSTQRSGERRHDDIGYSVIRGGDMAGEHQVMLLGEGERIELNHRAADRTIFARGALHAARWLASQPSGMYSVDDSLPDATQ